MNKTNLEHQVLLLRCWEFTPQTLLTYLKRVSLSDVKLGYIQLKLLEPVTEAEEKSILELNGAGSELGVILFDSKERSRVLAIYENALSCLFVGDYKSYLEWGKLTPKSLPRLNFNKLIPNFLELTPPQTKKLLSALIDCQEFSDPFQTREGLKLLMERYLQLCSAFENRGYVLDWGCDEFKPPRALRLNSYSLLDLLTQGYTRLSFWGNPPEIQEVLNSEGFDYLYDNNPLDAMWIFPQGGERTVDSERMGYLIETQLWQDTNKLYDPSWGMFFPDPNE